MPYECSSIADPKTIAVQLGSVANAVRMQSSKGIRQQCWFPALLPNTFRGSKNSNKMQLEYLEWTSNKLQM